MTVTPAGHSSHYQLALDDFNTRQKIFLLQSTIRGWSAQGAPQPNYPFGSDAGIMYGLGQTIGVLKAAAATGLYGLGTHVDRFA